MSGQQADDRAAVELAVSVASYALGIRTDEIIQEARGSQDVCFARKVAMYLAHVGFEMSLQRVAVAFARDRSTVASACHAIEDRREDAQFDMWIGTLEAMLRDAPAPHARALARQAQ